MRYRAARTRYPRRRRSWARRTARLFLIPMLAGAAAVLAAEGLDFVLLNLNSHEVTGGCAITRVIDGDTVALRCKTTGKTRGRLRGIDAPELFSASCIGEAIAAQRAKWALQRLLWSGDKNRIIAHGVDKYDRQLVTILVDGRSVAESLIASGHARRYTGGERGGWC